MEDSGIDSDSKTNSCNGGDRPQQDQPASLKFDGCEEDMNEAQGSADKSQDALPEEPQKSAQDQAASKSRALQLHRRLERHIQQSKKIRQQTRNACIDTQPKKTLLPRSRLPVPNKGQGSTAQPSGDTEPLVTWKSDSEEDFEFQPTSKAAAREITQQLIRDGYDLDLTPDDDDLDLIPPKPLSQRCSCCNPSQTCSIMWLVVVLSLVWLVLLREEECLSLGSALGADVCTSILFLTFQPALLQLICMNLSILIRGLYLPGECFNFWSCYCAVSESVVASAVWNWAVYLLLPNYWRDASTWQSCCITWQTYSWPIFFSNENLRTLFSVDFWASNALTKERATVRAVICLLSTAHE